MYSAQIMILLLGLCSLPLITWGQMDSKNVASSSGQQRVSQIQIGFMAGATGDVYFFGYNSSPLLSVAHGRRIEERLAVLGSVGIENHKDGTLLPLALNLDVSPRKNNKQKLQIQLGYSIGLNHRPHENFQYKGGFLTGLDYGFHLLQLRETSVFFTIGYQFRRTSLQYNPFGDGHIIRKELDTHFFALKTGLEF